MASQDAAKQKKHRVTVSIIAMPERDAQLAELIEFLDKQTEQDFDIRITRPPSTAHPDGNIKGLKALFNAHAQNITPERVQVTRAPEFHENQRWANQRTRLKQAAADNEVIVFLDDDDRVPPDYIATGLSAMTGFKADVVTGDLWAFTEGREEDGFTPLLSRRQNYGDRITKKDLVHSNRVGLGHVFVKSAALGSIPDEITKDVQVIDWAIFARMAHEGREIRFAGPDLHIEYRQHNGPVPNISGILRTDHKTMLWALSGKAKHYRAMAKSRYVDAKDKRMYDRLSDNFNRLYKRASQDPEFLDAYIDDMQARAKRMNITQAPFWWETAGPSTKVAKPSLRPKSRRRTPGQRLTR